MSIPRSFSPLADALPERTSPGLQYLQTRFATLMSYGLTVDVLDEILPLGQPLAVDSIRRRVQHVSERIETSTAQAPPPATAAPSIPAPRSGKAIGIDGGYVRATRQHRMKAGSKSSSARVRAITVPTDVSATSIVWSRVLHNACNAFSVRKACNRMIPSFSFRMAAILCVMLRPALTPIGDVLDWFHISMRFQNLIQMAKALQESEGSPRRDAIMEDLHG